MPRGSVFMEQAFALSLAYLAGSVPFAYLLARSGGVDLRRIGSGNIGATNVLRSRGVRAAVIVVCLDALKGSLAVLVAERLASGPGLPVAAGLASVVGHVYPVWLRFRGGKGVATAAGAFGVLVPGALAIAGVVFVLTVWMTRFISVGSMAGAITLAVAAGLTGATAAVTAGAAAAAALILSRHRANLERLVAGTERRVGQRLLSSPGTPLAD